MARELPRSGMSEEDFVRQAKEWARLEPRLRVSVSPSGLAAPPREYLTNADPLFARFRSPATKEEDSRGPIPGEDGPEDLEDPDLEDPEETPPQRSGAQQSGAGDGFGIRVFILYDDVEAGPQLFVGLSRADGGPVPLKEALKHLGRAFPPRSEGSSILFPSVSQEINPATGAPCFQIHNCGNAELMTELTMPRGDDDSGGMEHLWLQLWAQVHFNALNIPW